MKLHDYPETGSLSIELKAQPGVEVREETLRRNSRIPGTLSRAAMLDGVVVYERT